MIVEIIRAKDKKDMSKGKKIERIEWDGNTFFPFYINCLSMEFTREGIRIYMLDDYKIQWTFPLPEEMKKGQKKRLWIIGDSGKDRNTINRYEPDDFLSERDKYYQKLRKTPKEA